MNNKFVTYYYTTTVCGLEIILSFRGITIKNFNRQQQFKFIQNKNKLFR